MLEQPGDLEPESATTPEDYVRLLRRLRASAGISFREIERRSTTAGEQLPPSTVASMLARNTLPRERLVAAYVRACGVEPGDVGRWLEVRRRIALSLEAADSEDPQPALQSNKWNRVVLAIGVIVALSAASAGLWLALTAGDSKPPAEQSSPPADRTLVDDDAVSTDLPPPGPYRIRIVHSNLCLSEMPDQDSGFVFQTDCDRAFPALTLDDAGDGVYRIRTDHPEFGPGCMGVVRASTEQGAVIGDSFCDADNAGGEDFWLEPMAAPLAGYRLHPQHSGLCLGVPNDSTEDWAPLRQMACDSITPGQIFRFDQR